MSVDTPSYDLYYTPAYEITGFGWLRDQRDKELHAFLQTMEAHISRFGVQFPIGVHIRTSGADIRPGKCRVTACQRLGLSTVPAIVADYTRRPIQHPWERLPYDAGYITERFFAGSDSVAEVSRRFFSIKKTATVRRPGVEDRFTSELLNLKVDK